MRFPFRPFEERSDEAPRAGRARPTPDPEVVAKPKRRQYRRVSARTRRRIAAHSPARWAVCFAARTASVGARRPHGLARELAAKKRGAKPASNATSLRCEGARARGASGSPGARVAHRAHDPGRAGKSCRAAGIEPRTRNALLIAVQPLAARVGVAPACQALGASRATTVVRGQLPGTSPVQRPPGRCVKPSASRS